MLIRQQSRVRVESKAGQAAWLELLSGIEDTNLSIVARSFDMVIQRGWLGGRIQSMDVENGQDVVTRHFWQIEGVNDLVSLGRHTYPASYVEFGRDMDVRGMTRVFK